KTKKLPLDLLVRSVNGHTFPCRSCHRRIHAALYRSSESPTDLVRASTLTCLRRRPRIPKEVSGGSVRLLLCRREATGLRGGPRGGSTPSGRNAMSEPRFTTLTPETMTADQKRVADAI